MEVVGSWDNFRKTYPLRRDKRMGPGQWRGCHRFGQEDESNVDRTGDIRDTFINPGQDDAGLTMGKTYWYYVRAKRPYTAI